MSLVVTLSILGWSSHFGVLENEQAPTQFIFTLSFFYTSFISPTFDVTLEPTDSLAASSVQRSTVYCRCPIKGLAVVDYCHCTSTPRICSGQTIFHFTLASPNRPNVRSQQIVACTRLFCQRFCKAKAILYIFAHGAAGFAKRRRALMSAADDPSYFSMQIGEDAYFHRYDALGVADGVGGWSGTLGK